MTVPTSPSPPAALAELVVLAAGLVLPYTLTLSGQGPFYAKVGVPACVAAARDDLARQKAILARTCARDGGALTGGDIVDTMVQGQHCTSVQPLTCETPKEAERRAKRAAGPAGADPDAPPRA